MSVSIPVGGVVAKEEDRKTGLAAESTLPMFQSSLLAGVYMLGSISFFLLIRYSKVLVLRGELVYQSAAVVLLTELLKCIFSVGMMYYRTGKFLPVTVFTEGTWRKGIYYAVPSGIYAVYNNLTYLNLENFDPGTYQVFMQTRVLFTGVLYTIILKRAITSRKWLGLCLLTFGVAAKYITPSLQLNGFVLFMLFQASLSAFAGVYNEFLLKKDLSMDVNEQNFFMYAFALLFNLIIGLVMKPDLYTSGRLGESAHWVLFLIAVNGAIVGIVTSLILKFINVIVKAFASACEVLLTAILAAMFLGDKLTVQDVIACCIVMASIYVYYS